MRGLRLEPRVEEGVGGEPPDEASPAAAAAVVVGTVDAKVPVAAGVDVGCIVDDERGFKFNAVSAPIVSPEFPAGTVVLFAEALSFWLPLLLILPLLPSIVLLLLLLIPLPGTPLIPILRAGLLNESGLTGAEETNGVKRILSVSEGPRTSS